MIKAKDPQLHQINIAIPGFLTGPPPEGTHQVELPSQHSAEEEATFSHLIPKEAVEVVEVSNFDEVLKLLASPKP